MAEKPLTRKQVEAAEDALGREADARTLEECVREELDKIRLYDKKEDRTDVSSP